MVTLWLVELLAALGGVRPTIIGCAMASWKDAWPSPSGISLCSVSRPSRYSLLLVGLLLSVLILCTSRLRLLLFVMVEDADLRLRLRLILLGFNEPQYQLISLLAFPADGRVAVAGHSILSITVIAEPFVFFHGLLLFFLWLRLLGLLFLIILFLYFRLLFILIIVLYGLLSIHFEILVVLLLS